MDKKQFIEKRPYLYHLTDKRNLDFIKSSSALFSTTELVSMSSLDGKKAYLTTRRDGHSLVEIEGIPVFVRDQKPITRALDRCLTGGMTREEFIQFLNSRVFFWPTLKRLGIHFKTYEKEKPVILRASTEAIFKLNKEPLFTHLNSGATRCIPMYKGAPPRGKETFQPAEKYDKPLASVAEVTFLNTCLLPESLEISTNPDGDWKKVK